MNFFGCRLTSEDGTFRLITPDGSESVFFTARSLDRERKILRDQQADNQPGFRLIWISPHHPELEVPADTVWISPSPAFSENVIDNNEKLLYWQREIGAEDRFRIAVHPQLRRIFSGAAEDFIRDVLKQAAIRLKTIRHFGKTWEYNHRRNQNQWEKMKPLGPGISRPQLLVLGGQSVERNLELITKAEKIWCADTAVSFLTSQGLMPDLIFSTDAGRGSLEHFHHPLRAGLVPSLKIVLDCLSFPPLFEFPFSEKFGYLSSHPLLQNNPPALPELENREGDVGGLMSAAFRFLFPGESEPVVIGRDGRNSNGISHLRGSGYHAYCLAVADRFFTVEDYLCRLNGKYG